MNANAVEMAVAQLLTALGEDPTREGLRETPARVARFYKEWWTREPVKFTTFDAEGMTEMIVQSEVPFASLCEHHMLPFIGTATVGYIPGHKIVGLSKLTRAVRWCAEGLQNQERITAAVANCLQEHLEPRGIGVVLRARHMCMELRGTRVHGVQTTTQVLRGVFLTDAMARSEFLSLAQGATNG